MLGMLEVILGRHRIAGALRVAGKLKIFLGDVMRSPANLHLRPVRFVNPGERIVMMTAATATAATPVTLVIAVASAHALVVLSVSHDCLSLTPVSGDCGPADSSPNFKPNLPSHASQALRHDVLVTARPISRARKPISSASDTTVLRAAKQIAAAL
jgi:hypothetical protein